MRTWWDILSLYETLLVWPLAAFVGFALLRAKSRRRRLVLGIVLCAVFLPHIHRYVGDLYFDHLCETQAGEFIYRTVDNVEGILQMRPRDGSKDYFDRMRDGDIPEDPWGHTNREAQSPWHMVQTYKFIEVPASILPSPYRRSWYDESMFELPLKMEKIARYSGYDGKSLRTIRKEFAHTPRSIFGFTWSEIGDSTAIFFNIYGGEISAVALQSGEILATKRGFYRSRPAAICPRGKDDSQTERFLAKVLRPATHERGEAP